MANLVSPPLTAFKSAAPIGRTMVSQQGQENWNGSEETTKSLGFSILKIALVDPKLESFELKSIPKKPLKLQISCNFALISVDFFGCPAFSTKAG